MHNIGEYVGDGRGEAATMAPSTVNSSSVVDSPVDADPVVEYHSAEGDEDDGDGVDKCGVDDTRPLLTRLQGSASIRSTLLTLLPKFLTVLLN